MRPKRYWIASSGFRDDGLTRLVLRPLLLAAFIAMAVISVAGQDINDGVAPMHRIGEKLSYNITYGNLPTGGTAEIFVVSKGKLSGRPAVEIRSRIKTSDFLSATFLFIDISRMVYVASDSGLPLFVSSISYDGPIPKETNSNFLSEPTVNFDLVSLIFKIRESGGVGTFRFFEGDQAYTITCQLSGRSSIKTDAGTFDTNVVSMQSEFFTAKGFKEVQLQLSDDEDRIPLAFSFKAPRGRFQALLVTRTLMDDEPPTPVPTLTPTPVTVVTPRPSPTPDAYVDNRPLLPELGFVIGDTQEFRVTTDERYLGKVRLNVKERKRFNDRDSLLLTASVVDAVPGNGILNTTDSFNVQVDPETLAPRWFESKFAFPLPPLNQTVIFDDKTGRIAFGAESRVDAPIGTHSILSLIYAMRSFNLRPSKDPTNPVNDTRVAVFWESKAHIFTLRPSPPAEIEINGSKVYAQMVAIATGDAYLDSLEPKIWLNAETRAPVRISLGKLLLEIASESTNTDR